MLLLAANLRSELNQYGSTSHAEKRKRYARLTPPNQSHRHTVVAFVVVVDVAASHEDAVGVEPIGKREPRGETQALRTAHTS